MDDDAFLAAFESGRLPNESFRHRDHLRLAWLYLRRDGPELGTHNILTGIRHFATAHGAVDRFNETLTRFWIRLVQHLIETFAAADTFDDLLAHFPRLADKSLVYRHYSQAALWSPVARQGWLEPDLRPLA
jgi:hypothetical protein